MEDGEKCKRKKTHAYIDCKYETMKRVFANTYRHHTKKGF